MLSGSPLPVIAMTPETADPLADVVSGQYEKWVYPEPIRDLPAWLAGNWQWFDPAMPSGSSGPTGTIGQTSTSSWPAAAPTRRPCSPTRTPAAKVVAIDVSAASLDHHRFLKDKYGLKNLELHRLPIEEVGTLGRDYDLVVSTGVLHHMASPEAGHAGARRVPPARRRGGHHALRPLRPDRRRDAARGVSRPRPEQDEPSLAVVKAAVAALPQDHPLRSYCVAPGSEFDAGLVDTFLHGRDRSYTVADCLDLVAAGGLVFQDWFLKTSYEPAAAPENPFLAAVASLPNEERWGVMERMNHRNACHFFTACRPERPPETYRLDFEGDSGSTPCRCFATAAASRARRSFAPAGRCRLTPEQLALVKLVDGRRTIREMIAAAAASAQDDRSPAERNRFAQALFVSLVNRDFVVLTLGRDRAGQDGTVYFVDGTLSDSRPSPSVQRLHGPVAGNGTGSHQ